MNACFCPCTVTTRGYAGRGLRRPVAVHPRIEAHCTSSACQCLWRVGTLLHHTSDAFFLGQLTQEVFGWRMRRSGALRGRGCWLMKAAARNSASLAASHCVASDCTRTRRDGRRLVTHAAEAARARRGHGARDRSLRCRAGPVGASRATSSHRGLAATRGFAEWTSCFGDPAGGHAPCARRAAGWQECGQGSQGTLVPRCLALPPYLAAHYLSLQQ